MLVVDGTPGDSAPEPGSGRPRRRRPVLVAAAAVGVVAIFLVVVFAVSKVGGSDTADTPLLGQAAPAITGPQLDGGAFDLSTRRGSWVVLNFFASWCDPCKQEAAELARFASAQQSAGTAGAELVGIVYNDSRGRHPLVPADLRRRQLPGRPRQAGQQRHLLRRGQGARDLDHRPVGHRAGEGDRARDGRLARRPAPAGARSRGAVTLPPPLGTVAGHGADRRDRARGGERAVGAEDERRAHRRHRQDAEVPDVRRRERLHLPGGVGAGHQGGDRPSGGRRAHRRPDPRRTSPSASASSTS